jgi:hypothetical protein
MLRYMAGYKQKQRKAAWLFGDAMEGVCNDIILGLVKDADGAVTCFEQRWEPVRMDPLVQWPSGQYAISWSKYRDRGKVLVRLVWDWIVGHIDLTPGTFTLQDEIRYTIGPSKELCYLDFRGRGRKEVGDKFSLGILDFKTAQRREPDHLLELDEQLTDYQVGSEMKYPDQEIQWLAHLRMVAVTAPYLQVLWAPRRMPEVVRDFLSGAMQTNREILQGNFTSNTRQCHQWGGCWGQPVCFSSQKGRLEQELVVDEQDKGEAAAAAADIEL